MKDSLVRWLAWSLCLLTAFFAWGSLIAAVWMDGWNALKRVDEVVFIAILVAPAVAGALVATRLPANIIGWLMLLLALSNAAESFNNTFNPDEQLVVTSAGWQWFAWAFNVVFITSLIGTMTLFLQVFPTGRAVSRRWQPLRWGTWLVLGLTALNLAFGSELVNTEPRTENPAYTKILGDVFGLVGTLGLLINVLLVPGSLAALVVRFRQASGIERQQLKWFVYMAGIIVASLIAATALIPLGWGDTELNDILIYFGLFVGTGLGLPTVIAIAMLRYRLYDIDRLINRTLVYGLLSALLLGIYFGLVLGLETLVRESTGESSPVVVAASTLAVAALFRPLRSRIQGMVDRRFYRSKYDAERTLERFSERLREEIDLETLSTELLAIVSRTMQPAQVGVWVRPAQPHIREDSPR